LAESPIKIGVPVGLSGANSVVAPSVVQSAELAVEEINKAGGVLGRTLVLEVADDGSGAAGAQKAFDSLIFQKKVDALISMETSAARNAGLPLVQRGKTPFIPRSMKGVRAIPTSMSMPGCPSNRCRRLSTTS
jgi:branched-chain amino acid transport system substrate-binding protein